MDRVASQSSTFTLAVTQPSQLPAVAQPSLAERFIEFRKVTGECRDDLIKAVSRNTYVHVPAVVRETETVQAFIRCHWKTGALGTVAGTVLALLAGVSTFFERRSLKALPAPSANAVQPEAPKPKRGSLEEVLGRLKGDTYSPTTLAALSTIAEEMLRAGEHSLSKEAKDALARVVWHGEMQDPIETERATRWGAMQAALEAFASLTPKSNPEDACKQLKSAFLDLGSAEREALAPIVREAVFAGEKPRVPVEFKWAKSFYERLANASPVTAPVPVVGEPSEPEGEVSLTRLGRDLFALEQAIARAVHPEARSIDAAVRLTSKIYERDVYERDDLLGCNLAPLEHYVSKRNTVIDVNVIRIAAGRALFASGNTPLERAALALVAERAMLLLDGLCILGHEARALLSAIVERGKGVAESKQAQESLDNQARQLYAVLRSFNVLEPGVGTDELVGSALALLNKVPDKDRADVARAVREQVFGAEPRTDVWFPGAVMLHRKLRALVEPPAQAVSDAS